MPAFLPLIGLAARIAGPAATRAAAGTVAKAATSKPGLAGMLGYQMGKSAGRNAAMHQGQSDGQNYENMQGYVPGRGA